MTAVPTQADATTKIKEIRLEAVVTRCGCAVRGLDFRDVHENLGGEAFGPCPAPLAVEDKGVIASYFAPEDDPPHNPIRRLWARAWRKP